MEKQEYLQSLVASAKSGNERGFVELYKLYYEKIYALARTTLKSEADAEDALQSTFIKAWQKLDSLEDGAAFNTWIQRIALNECYGIIRKRKGNISLDDDEFQLPISKEQAEEELFLPQAYAEREDLNGRLKQIIDQLSDVQRQSIMLYYFSELSVAEIADVMNCSEGTVKSRLFLARKSIKTEIEEQERKSGEKFYGVAGIPMVWFGKVFVAQIKGTMLSKSVAAAIIKTVLTGASRGAAQAASGKAAAGAVAKASLPLSKKILAIIFAGVVAIGGTIGTIAFLRSQKKAAEQAPQVTQTTVASKSEKQEKPKEIVDAELGENEESLTEFLTYYFWTYREFDCTKVETPDKGEWVYRNSLHGILGYPPGVDFRIYPVQEPVELSGEALEQKQTQYSTNWGIYEYSRESVYWIAENIFNMKQKEIDTCVEMLLEEDTTENVTRVYSDTNEKGKETYYVTAGGVGGIEVHFDYTDVKTDGEKYYIKYNMLYGGSEVQTYFALMELKYIDGKDYWTIYKNTADIPEEIFGTEEVLDFSEFSGEYCFKGNGDRITELTLHDDGSFEGEFRNFNAHLEPGYYYVYKAKFSGKFSNLKKAGDYSFSATLSELNKEPIEETEEETDYGWKIRTVEAKAEGIEGGENFRFCVDGTPVGRLPNACKQWLQNTIGDPGESVPGTCFYNEDSSEKYCFCKPQE